MKKLAAAAMLLSCLPSWASDLSTEFCDIDLNAKVQLNKEFIEITQQDQSFYRMIGSERLIVNGQEINLTESQQVLMAHYVKTIKALVPELEGMIIYGMKLAIDGTEQAMEEVIRKNKPLADKAEGRLRRISRELQLHFSLNNGIQFDESGAFSDSFFSAEILLPEPKSTLRLIMAAAKDMWLTVGDINGFEAKRATFRDFIEQHQEQGAPLLPQLSEALCELIAYVDDVEEVMRDEIVDIADINMLDVTLHQALDN